MLKPEMNSAIKTGVPPVWITQDKVERNKNDEDIGEYRTRIKILYFRDKGHIIQIMTTFYLKLTNDATENILRVFEDSAFDRNRGKGEKKNEIK
ncbi:9919_t:CDS:2 [Acaulospora morrowiae]|uniref:9919_t:CDS:1 n=1 Tax=Acaulospora morrowiae TaxID=94023 RepID=A0A9N9GG85_9GLOM|nr:9919_t:CDS:2 [Acaulospora morrowiae]